METELAYVQLNQSEHNETVKNIKVMETGKKKRMTASEKRFAKEMETLIKMSLSDLMVVERKRMPVGV
ncbi:MAG: hypothetical protein H6603_01325 [Flavobacteriales bacterium]|nr:hypothetical protein [Flavobacteriales bacterium]MCB9203591.1 hypothetical protein [Flavobacteriales bacterium]